MRYRKKPVVIEAIQYKDTFEKTLKEIKDFCPTSKYLGAEGHYFLIIPTLEGDMRASAGDWIIRGVNGEYYPCKPDIFEKT